MDQRYSEMIWARATPGLVQQLYDAAREERRDKSEIVRLAVEEWLDRRQKINTIVRPARELLDRS